MKYDNPTSSPQPSSSLGEQQPLLHEFADHLERRNSMLEDIATRLDFKVNTIRNTNYPDIEPNTAPAERPMRGNSDYEMFLFTNIERLDRVIILFEKSLSNLNSII